MNAATVARTVGSYELLREIGEGGMGTVYLARHTLIGRTAAVKVLKPELTGNAAAVERFFNEARAASNARHPGIVEIYDFGQDAADLAYIVMEHLPGESLRARLSRVGRMDVPAALSLARQIARALGAAHAGGVIHRDLKPDNVIVVPDPDVVSGERAKVLDFGIAKLSDADTSGMRTHTGTIMGTPAYMAPEQCRGAGHVDLRADLYALGCMLFEMLCGRPPFSAAGVGELIAKHIYEAPPSPRTFQPSVPIDVDTLVCKLLSKNPEHRYQTAAETVTALGAVLGAACDTESSWASTVEAPADRRPIPTTIGSSVGAVYQEPVRHARYAWTAIRGVVAAVVVLAATLAFLVFAVASGRMPRDSHRPTELPASAAPAVAPPTSRTEPPPAIEPVIAVPVTDPESEQAPPRTEQAAPVAEQPREPRQRRVRHTAPTPTGKRAPPSPNTGPDSADVGREAPPATTLPNVLDPFDKE